MQLFLQVVLSYPTLPLSIVLSVCLLYWLLMATGLLGDGLDLGLADGVEAEGIAHAVAAILGRLGLTGAPLMLVLTLLVFFSWTQVYLLQLLLLQGLPGFWRFALGSLGLLLAPLPAAPATALVLRPFRRMWLRARTTGVPQLLGRTGVVISAAVTASEGRATLDDGGAGLVLQVRSRDGASLPRGQAVMLVEYDPKAYCYYVIAADALEQASAPVGLLESGDKESG